MDNPFLVKFSQDIRCSDTDQKNGPQIHLPCLCQTRQEIPAGILVHYTDGVLILLYIYNRHYPFEGKLPGHFIFMTEIGAVMRGGISSQRFDKYGQVVLFPYSPPDLGIPVLKNN